MFDDSSLVLFLLAAWVLLITPGPAVLYIVARSVDQGQLAGIVSTLGVGVGTFVHVAAATLGISALLVSSALAFSVVKYVGAAYLVYLGVRMLRTRDVQRQPGASQGKALVRIFCDGVVGNALNPKTALFFFAFLPQFVDVSRGVVALQVFALGAMFVIMGIFSDGLRALRAGSVGHWLKHNARYLRAQRYFAGSVLIALGWLPPCPAAARTCERR
ncbi:MAG: LysE family translocator [Acidiferrobacterales bacterium]